MKKTLLVAIVALVVTVLTSLLSMLFEKVLVVAHLMVHFQLQYFTVIIFFSLTLLLFKKWKVALPGLVYAIALYVLSLHPLSLFPGQIDSVDIFYINSHYSNENFTPIVDAIESLDPKTIAIVESNPALVEKLGDVRPDLILNHRAYASSCTIYADEALDANVEGRTHLPLCIAEFKDFDLLTVHAHRPLGKANLEENIEFFDQIKEILDEYEDKSENFILVGDFNSSLYSSYFRDRFSNYVHINFYTWMTNTPLALPIDHVMTNMDIEFVRTGNLGSDHRALLIQINEAL
jgi:hypothetical protein